MRLMRFHRGLLPCSRIWDVYNPNDPCFEWKGPCFGGLTLKKNKGQLGSRYIPCHFPFRSSVEDGLKRYAAVFSTNYDHHICIIDFVCAGRFISCTKTLCLCSHAILAVFRVTLIHVHANILPQAFVFVVLCWDALPCSNNHELQPPFIAGTLFPFAGNAICSTAFSWTRGFCLSLGDGWWRSTMLKNETSNSQTTRIPHWNGVYKFDIPWLYIQYW